MPTHLTTLTIKELQGRGLMLQMICGMNISNLIDSQGEALALSKESLAAERIVRSKRLEVDSHMASEIEELRYLHDQIHDAEVNILRAEKYYKITLSEYARGAKGSPDVLGASEKLFQTKTRRIEIIRDFQIAKTHVLSKIGK
jgi:outer membrane protein